MIKVKKLDDKQLEVLKNKLLERVTLEELSQHVKGLNCKEIEIYNVTQDEINNAFVNISSNMINGKLTKQLSRRLDSELTKLLVKMEIKLEFYDDIGFWNGLTFEYLIEFINLRNSGIYDAKNDKILQRLYFSPSQSKKTRHIVYSLFLNLLCTYDTHNENSFDLTWFVIEEYYEVFNTIYEKSYFKDYNTAKNFLKGFKKFTEDGNKVSSKDLQYIAKILSESSGVYYLDFFDENDFYQLLEKSLQ